MPIFQGFLHVFWQPLNKAGREFLQLPFCDMETFHDRIHQGIYDNPHRLAECNIIQFIHQTEIQFTQRLFIRIHPLRHGKHHIPCERYRCMGIQCVIRDAPALFYQTQIRFTGFEEYFYFPYAGIYFNPQSR